MIHYFYCFQANAYAQQLEKKQKGFDKVIDEWKRKCDDLHAELDACQREARNAATDVFRLKNSNDELNEAAESVRRENKNLAQEIKDLTDQLGEGGRSVHEMQKMIRRLELEKEELQQALDEAEAALEAEESKVLRSQIEVSQIRQEIEKRIHVSKIVSKLSFAKTLYLSFVFRRKKRNLKIPVKIINELWIQCKLH